MPVFFNDILPQKHLLCIIQLKVFSQLQLLQVKISQILRQNLNIRLEQVNRFLLVIRQNSLPISIIGELLFGLVLDLDVPLHASIAFLRELPLALQLLNLFLTLLYLIIKDPFVYNEPLPLVIDIPTCHLLLQNLILGQFELIVEGLDLPLAVLDPFQEVHLL